MSEWTPGPWTLSEVGGQVISVHGPNFETVVEAVFDYGDPALDCSIADARLIALAPEMAELLAQMTANVEPGTFVTALDVNTALERARDLLKRARGEALPPTGN